VLVLLRILAILTLNATVFFKNQRVAPRVKVKHTEKPCIVEKMKYPTLRETVLLKINVLHHASKCKTIEKAWYYSGFFVKSR
jgi:hypothetical protein